MTPAKKNIEDFTPLCTDKLTLFGSKKLKIFSKPFNFEKKLFDALKIIQGRCRNYNNFSLVFAL
jgi:hypothetical protein